jgi:hypothetical protein
MLEEPPASSRVVSNRPLDEGVAHLACGMQQSVGPSRVRPVLRGIDQHVSHSGSATAAPVVVPEARPQPSGDTRGQDRAQAPLP